MLYACICLVVVTESVTVIHLHLSVCVVQSAQHFIIFDNSSKRTLLVRVHATQQRWSINTKEHFKMCYNRLIVFTQMRALTYSSAY